MNTIRRIATCVLLLGSMVFANSSFAVLSEDPNQDKDKKQNKATETKANGKGNAKTNKDKVSGERLSTRDLDSPDTDVKAKKPAKKNSKPPAKPDAKDPK